MTVYFSNGTEGHEWEANWCGRCDRDHACHSADPDYNNGCPILAQSYLDCRADDPPIPEWTEVDGRVHCLAYAPCPCVGGGPDEPAPKPVPVHPDQRDIFDLLVEQETVPDSPALLTEEAR